MHCDVCKKLQDGGTWMVDRRDQQTVLKTMSSISGTPKDNETGEKTPLLNGDGSGRRKGS